MLWNRSVWPSGAALATWSAPNAPPAPPTFSTSTVWPRLSVMRCANKRASMSVVAPAGNGTMIRIVLVGDQACAIAGLPMSADAPSAAVPARIWRRVLIVFMGRPSRMGRLPRPGLILWQHHRGMCFCSLLFHRVFGRSGTQIGHRRRAAGIEHRLLLRLLRADVLLQVRDGRALPRQSE